MYTVLTCGALMALVLMSAAYRAMKADRKQSFSDYLPLGILGGLLGAVVEKFNVN